MSSNTVTKEAVLERRLTTTLLLKHYDRVTRRLAFQTKR